jgi:hypothetical protein
VGRVGREGAEVGGEAVGCWHGSVLGSAGRG